LHIVFDSDRFIVADKPGGALSVPGRMGAADPRPVFGRQLEEHLGCRLWPVHRLDAEVSGLIVYAKDETAHTAACGWFEARLVIKTYEAWTEPKPGALACVKGGEHQWTSKLLRGKKRAYESPHGKMAVTKAKCKGSVILSRKPVILSEAKDLLRDSSPTAQNDRRSAQNDGNVCVWELLPQTGRPHQLRYELFRHGHPIVGDKLYGATTEFLAQTIALRAVALDLTAVPDRLGLPATLTVQDLASVHATGGIL
jgi:tRNA pseudouridine32 synthase/23S rRNA pseudouridine746 synthase